MKRKGLLTLSGVATLIGIFSIIVLWGEMIDALTSNNPHTRTVFGTLWGGLLLSTTIGILGVLFGIVAILYLNKIESGKKRSF